MHTDVPVIVNYLCILPLLLHTKYKLSM